MSEPDYISDDRPLWPDVKEFTRAVLFHIVRMNLLYAWLLGMAAGTLWKDKHYLLGCVTILSYFALSWFLIKHNRYEKIITALKERAEREESK